MLVHWALGLLSLTPGSGPEQSVRFAPQNLLELTLCKWHSEVCKPSVWQCLSRGREVLFGQLPLHPMLVILGRFLMWMKHLLHAVPCPDCCLSSGLSPQGGRSVAFSLVPLLRNFPWALLLCVTPWMTEEWHSHCCTQHFLALHSCSATLGIFPFW